MSQVKKILCIGPLWRGSNAGGLFNAISRLGTSIVVVDEFYYISLQAAPLGLKIMHKLIRPWQLKTFNDAILSQITLYKPEVLLVYKGAFVTPNVLKVAREKGIRLVNFYPDVSMFSHGKLLPQTMPHYELVFTTKSFGPNDLKQKFGIDNACYIPHGFDPEIHRPIAMDEAQQKMFSCDVSFIGTYSPKKEKYLTRLVEKMPEVDLKIWGDQWEKATSPAIKKSIMYTAVLGDLYIMAIGASRINLGILSEQVQGASSGDKITSRTFHIPASGGFMLHEGNPESELYFDGKSEVGFFSGEEDMADKVKYFLENPEIREQYRLKGYERAMRDHSLNARAKTVLSKMEKLF